MTDEFLQLQQKEGREDIVPPQQQSVSLTAQVLSMVGVGTYAMGMPTVWKNFKKNFPKGLSAYFGLQGRPNAVDIAFGVTRKMYGDLVHPENVVETLNRRLKERIEAKIETKTNLDRIIKRKQEFDIDKEVREKAKEGRLKDRLLDDVNVIMETEQKFAGINTSRSTFIYELRKLALYEYLAERPYALGSYVDITQINEKDIDKIISSLRGENNREFIRIYANRLKQAKFEMPQGRWDTAAQWSRQDSWSKPINFVFQRSSVDQLLETYKSKYEFAHTFTKQHQNMQMAFSKKVWEVARDSSRYHQATTAQFVQEMSQFDSSLDAVLPKQIGHVDMTIKTSSMFKSYLTVLDKEIRSRRNPQNNLTYKIRLVHMVQGDETFPTLRVTILSQSPKPGKLMITKTMDFPLTNSSNRIWTIGGAKEAKTMQLPSHGNAVKVTTATGWLMHANMQAMKSLINDAAEGKETIGQGVYNVIHKRFANLMHDTPFSELEQAYKAGMLGSEEFDTSRGQGAIKKKQFNKAIQDIKFLQAAKRNGVDIVVYDTEYYHPDVAKKAFGHGPTINPKDIDFLQVAWRRYSSDGKEVGAKSGSFFVKPKNFDEKIPAIKSMLINSLGYSQADADVFIENLRRAKPIEEVMHHMKGAFDNCVIVDQGGSTSLDRIGLKREAEKAGIQNFMSDERSIDMTKLSRGLSPFAYGHHLEEAFGQILHFADEGDINGIIHNITHESKLGDRAIAFANEVKRQFNSPQALTKDQKINLLWTLFAKFKHDAENDAGRTWDIYTGIMKRYGVLGSSKGFNEMEENFTTFHNLTRNWMGHATSPKLRNSVPTDAPEIVDNIFGMWDSQQRAVYQKMSVFQLIGHEHLRGQNICTPYNRGFEMLRRSQGLTAVADNIAKNANPVTMGIFAAMNYHGTSLAQGELDSQTFKHVYSHYTVLDKIKFESFGSVPTDLSALQLNSDIERYVKIATERSKLDSYAHYKPEKRVSVALRDVMREVRGEIEGLWEKYRMAPEDQKGILEEEMKKYYNIKPGDSVVFNQKSKNVLLKNDHHRLAAITDVRIMSRENQILEIAVEFDRLINYAHGGKFSIAGTGQRFTAQSLADFSKVQVLSHNDIADINKERTCIVRPQVIVGMIPPSRKEFGAYRRMQFMRVINTLYATKRHKEAEQFARDIFGKLMYTYDSKTGSIIYDGPLSTVDADRELSQIANKQYSVTQRYMKNTHTWNRETMGMLKEELKIKAATELDEYNAFKEVHQREKKKLRLEIAAARKTGEVITWEQEQIMLLSRLHEIDPFLDVDVNMNIIKKRVERDKKNPFTFRRNSKINDHIRPIDILQHGAKRYLGIYFNDALFSVSTYENSNQPIFNKQIQISKFVLENQMRFQEGWLGSSVMKTVRGSIGLKGLNTRESFRKSMSYLIASESVKNEGVIMGHEDLNFLTKQINELRNYRTGTLASYQLKQLVNMAGKSNVKVGKSTVKDCLEQMLMLENELKKENLLVTPNTDKIRELNTKIDKLRRMITGRTKVGIHNAEISYNTADELRGTLWEDRPRDPFGGYPAFEIKRNSKNRIAMKADDFLLIKAPGVYGKDADKFFSDIIVDTITQSKARDQKSKEMLLKTMKYIKKASEGLEFLPMVSRQAWQEIMGRNVMSTEERVMHMDRSIEIYENVITAASEYNNALAIDKSNDAAFMKARDERITTSREGLKSAYREYHTHLYENLYDRTNKKSPMRSEHFAIFDGQYGEGWRSDVAYKYAADQFNALGNNRAEAIQKIFSIRKTQRKGFTWKQAEEEYVKMKKYLRFMRDPRYSFLALENFNKAEIGGVPYKTLIKEQFLQQYSDIKTAAKKLTAFYNGDKGLAVGIARAPYERSISGLWFGESRIMDTNLLMFQGAEKSFSQKILISPFLAIAMLGDFDGDNFEMSFLNAQSVKQMDAHLKDTRKMVNKRFALMHEYQKLRLKGMGVQEATEALKEKFSGRAEAAMFSSLMEGAFGQGIGLGRRVVTVGGKRRVIYEHLSINKGMSTKMGLKDEYETTVDQLKSFVEGMTPEIITRKRVRAGELALLSKGMIGRMANRTADIEIVMKHLEDLMTEGSTTSLEILKSLGLDPKEVKNAVNNKGLEVFKGMRDQFTLLSGLMRRIPQDAIGMKKLQDQWARQGLSLTAQTLDNLIHPQSPQVFEGMMKKVFGWTDSPTLKLISTAVHMATRIAATDAGGLLLGLEKNPYRLGSPVEELRQRATEILAGMNNPDAKLAIEDTLDIMGINQNSAFKKANDAWKDSLTQMIFGRKSWSKRNGGINRELILEPHDKFRSMKKFVYEHNLGKWGLMLGAGVALTQFFNPNNMTGGIRDGFMDIGNSPGTPVGDVFGTNALPIKNFAPGAILGLTNFEDSNPFDEKWARIVAKNPALDDKLFNLSGKSYKDFGPPTRDTFNRLTGKRQRFQRNYIDSRHKFSKRYQTEDMRRIKLIGNYDA